MKYILIFIVFIPSYLYRIIHLSIWVLWNGIIPERYYLQADFDYQLLPEPDNYLKCAKESVYYRINLFSQVIIISPDKIPLDEIGNAVTKYGHSGNEREIYFYF